MKPQSNYRGEIREIVILVLVFALAYAGLVVAIYHRLTPGAT